MVSQCNPSGKCEDATQRVAEAMATLKERGMVNWTDEYRATTIRIGHEMLPNLIDDWEEAGQDYAVIVSPAIKGKIHVPSSRVFDEKAKRYYDSILSIGSSREHCAVRAYVLSLSQEMITAHVCMPVPLSNDSFCTNMNSAMNGDPRTQSVEASYPSQVIVDMTVLGNLEPELNLRGIGEFIGLFYSLRDYHMARIWPTPHRLIRYIERNARELSFSVKRGDSDWIPLLAIGLIMKCLLMRVFKNHAIGAGGDHLLAYALDSIYRGEAVRRRGSPSHGELVYIGSVIMAALFPEWECGFFSLENLVDFGIGHGVVACEDLSLLTKMSAPELVSLARQMRPQRLSSLSSLEPGRIAGAWNRIAGALGRG